LLFPALPAFPANRVDFRLNLIVGQIIFDLAHNLVNARWICRAGIQFCSGLVHVRENALPAAFGEPAANDFKQISLLVRGQLLEGFENVIECGGLSHRIYLSRIIVAR
jgi:hypothetical protein